MKTRKPFTAIRLHDSAIDWAAAKAADPDIEGKYPTTRDTSLLYDPEKGVAHVYPGERPTVFTCRRLTRPQVQKFVSSATTDADRWIKAFQCGVIKIEFPDGTVYTPDWIARGALCMPEKDLADLEEEHDLETTDILDIGLQISVRSDVPFDCTPSCPVPPWSLRAWVAASLRSAARNRVAAPPSSDAAKEPAP